MKRSADFVGLLGRLDRSHGPVPGRERRPVVLVLENGPIHTSRTSREALALRPWLTVEWLPRYAPDLNGVITQGVQNRPDTVGEVTTRRQTQPILCIMVEFVRVEVLFSSSLARWSEQPFPHGLCSGDFANRSAARGRAPSSEENVGPHLGRGQQRSTSAAGDRSEVERFWVT